MEELADWEKDSVPKSEFDAEWIKATREIGAALSACRVPEDVLAVFDLKDAWLAKYPGDMPMRRLGGQLMRRVEWLGGDWEQFKVTLEEHRKTRLLDSERKAR